MNFKILSLVALGSLILSSFFSCSLPMNNSKVTKIDFDSYFSQIEGYVDFGIKNPDFKTKALPGDVIKKGATVSLIDPLTKGAIAVGLTDVEGRFVLISNYKVPVTATEIADRILLLEARKRFPDSIKGQVLTLRSLIRLRSSDYSFESISSLSPNPHVVNSLTTAVSLLVANGTITDVNQVFRTVAVTSETTGGVVNNIGAVSATTINNLKSQIDTYLGSDIDPINQILSTSVPGGIGG